MSTQTPLPTFRIYPINCLGCKPDKHYRSHPTYRKARHTVANYSKNGIHSSYWWCIRKGNGPWRAFDSRTLTLTDQQFDLSQICGLIRRNYATIMDAEFKKPEDDILF